MTSAASKLQAQLSELNELSERLRKAELVEIPAGRPQKKERTFGDLNPEAA
jgi:hypothetical protein